MKSEEQRKLKDSRLKKKAIYQKELTIRNLELVVGHLLLITDYRSPVTATDY